MSIINRNFLSRGSLGYLDIYTGVLFIKVTYRRGFVFQTVPTLLFTLYCLAKNPHSQQLVYEEITKAMPVGEPITADMIARLPYLKACVKEASR